MQMQVELRYSRLVRARVPRELSDAINATARARFMTQSEYVRQALLRSLKQDGLLRGVTICAQNLDEVKSQNCVLVSLAAITGKQPNVILVEMLQWAGPDRQIMDIADGLMWRRAYCEYLEAQGWKGTWEPCAIPPTALVILDGHAFAVVDGVLFDNGAQQRWNRKILAVYEPPAPQGPSTE